MALLKGFFGSVLNVNTEKAELTISEDLRVPPYHGKRVYKVLPPKNKYEKSLCRVTERNLHTLIVSGELNI